MDRLNNLCRANAVGELKCLLEEGSLSEIQLGKAILEALDADAFDSLDMLIQHPDVPVTYKTDKGETILHGILRKLKNDQRCLPLVKAVVSKLIDSQAVVVDDCPSASNSFGECGEKSALHILNAESGLEYDDQYFETPLLLALLGENYDVAKYLLSQGVEVNYDWYDDDNDVYVLDIERSPLLPLILVESSSYSPNNKEYVQLLLQHGARLNTQIQIPPQDPGSLGEFLEYAFEGDGFIDILQTMINVATKSNRLHLSDVLLILQHGDFKCMESYVNGCIEDYVTTKSPDLHPHQLAFLLSLFGKIQNIQYLLNHRNTLVIDINVSMTNPCKLLSRFTVLPKASMFCKYDRVTGLQIALLSGNQELLEVLLKNNVDIYTIIKNDLHPLCYVHCYQANTYSWRSRYISKDAISSKWSIDKDAVQCLKTMLRYGCELGATFISAWSQNCSLLDYFAVCRDLVMCEILIMAGSRTFHLQETMNALLNEDIKNGNDLATYITPNDVVAFIDRELHAVPSLRQLARNDSRSFIFGNLEAGINKMTLPAILKNYLNLEELTDIEEMYRDFLGKCTSTGCETKDQT